MNFKLKSTILGSILSLMAPTVLVAAEANDNYDTATTEKWVNDSSNKAVELLDIMTCMGGAGGISRPGFANKSWIALVDEVACGIDNGDTSAQEKKATIQFSSTLAAVGGTQEIVGYMEQSDGNKVIMNMQIKKGASALPPYGEWYSSFYFVADPSKDFAGQPGSIFHGYGEVTQVGSDVVVMSAHSPMNEGESPAVEARIVYTGGDVSDVTYNYKYSGLAGAGEQFNGNYLGKANSTDLYTVFSNADGAFQAGTAQCKKRDSVWQSSWKGALYETTTPFARLKLATPPFQFTLSDGSRGDARKDHSWMENNLVRLGLDPAANTLAATRADTDAAVTLQWTPTRMETKSYSDFTPATGDMFNSGASTNGMARWNGTYLTVDQDRNPENGYEVDHETFAKVWSSFYDAEFLYNGATNPPTWKMVNKTLYTSADYPDASSSALYKCWGTYNCPHTSTYLSNINPTLAEYKAIVADTSTDWWKAFHGGKNVTQSDTAEFHYYLTAITAPTGYLGATLYLDVEKDGLTTDDKPVMFKFNVANIVDADDGQWAKKAMSHGEDTAAYFSTDGNKINEDFTNVLDTAGMWATLIPSTSTCGVSNWQTCTDAVEFNARQYVYDHPLIPINAAGTVIDISPVMKMRYTQAIADDLNYNGGVPIEIPATFGAGEWVQWESKPCSPGDMGQRDGREIDLNTDEDDSTCQITINLSAFNEKVLNIRYDGEMNNLPGYYDHAQNTFYRLINPKDGAIFTDMADEEKTYKYKALGIDEVFVPTTVDSCSADVKFEAIPSNMSASFLPSYTDPSKSRPSQTWNTKPTAPSCILNGEVETNCD
jgi:hypothetical protein